MLKRIKGGLWEVKVEVIGSSKTASGKVVSEPKEVTST